jgi:hypothetical protein
VKRTPWPAALHDARDVPAGQDRELDGEDAIKAAAADLGVDQVDGDRLDANPDLAGRRLRDGGLRQGQDFRAAVTGVGDHGVHRVLLG